MRPDTLTGRIEAYLRENGPATARELATELRADFRNVRGRLHSLKEQGRSHIAGWRRDEDGGRLYPRALWAAGKGRDAARPAPLTRTDYNRRHTRRKAGAIASVFDLALRVADRRVPMDWRTL